MKREYQYSCFYSFVETAPKTYSVHFTLKNNSSQNVIHEDTRTYIPIKAKTNDNNEARIAINQWLRAMLNAWYGIGKGVKFKCTNDESDFLSRAEKARQTRMKRWATENASEAPADNTPVKVESKVDPTTDSRRVYEVVQVHGVWTIKRHEGELLTEQEAKTQLFAHIVNGD